MKLINFDSFEPFQNLLKRMGATKSDFNGLGEWNRINIEELRQRLESTGQIVEDISDIKISPIDGTFEYNGIKVLVYIRDQKFYPNRPRGEYKYHICYCTKIDQMFSNNRGNRYVVSTRKDGIFLINIKNAVTDEIIEENEYKPMHVCRYCLGKLNYKEYENSLRRDQNEIYNSFSLDEFFSKYHHIYFRNLPEHNEFSAPPDEYTSDFHLISENIRSDNKWCCSDCKVSFFEKKNYLHTHHIDGDKNNNDPENLIPLCILCHAKKHGHERLKYHPDYRNCVEYRNKKNSISNQLSDLRISLD